MDAQDFVQYIDDPSLVLDSEWRVESANPAFEQFFPEGVADKPIERVFDADPTLAADHADTLAHYPDVAGVIDGAANHFDPDHDTITALQDHRDPREDDPDMGVFVDGDLRYFDLSTVDIEDRRHHLLVFRDITRVKDHEQDLDFLRQVMGRVLRHNLRNDLSVIRGQATAIAESSDDERAEMAETITKKSDELVETSQKTRLIQQAIESTDRVDHDVEALVDHAIESVHSEHPAVDTSIETGIDAVEVRAVPAFRDALEDTIENAIIYGEGGSAEITATSRNGWATITVSDDGPGIPDHELAALEERGETELTHGSGAGLWLLYTSVRESRGDVSFDTENGTTVQIRLPAAD